MFRLDMCSEMHARAVPPDEEGRACLVLARNEILGRSKGLLVNRFHPLFGERAGILDLAVGEGMDHAARAKSTAEFRVLRIVAVLRLLLRIEVIQVAEKLVEAVIGRQVLVPVPLVVLAELARRVALALENGCHRDIRLLPAFLRAGEADLGHAGAHRYITANESGAPGRAALLSVIIREGQAFLSDPVDVRRLIAHHATIIMADIPGADVIAPDDQDVRLLGGPAGIWRLRLRLRLGGLRAAGCQYGRCRGNGSPAKQNAAPRDIGALAWITLVRNRFFFHWDHSILYKTHWEAGSIGSHVGAAGTNIIRAFQRSGSWTKGQLAGSRFAA